MQLEDLALTLGQLVFQTGGLFQIFLDLLAEIFGSGLLPVVLVGDVHAGQHGAVGQRQLALLHDLTDLAVHMGGYLAHIALILHGHHGVFLTGDGDNDLIFHEISSLLYLLYLRAQYSYFIIMVL